MQLSPAVCKLLNTCYFKRFKGNTNYKSTKEDIIVFNLDFYCQSDKIKIICTVHRDMTLSVYIVKIKIIHGNLLNLSNWNVYIPVTRRVRRVY